MVEHQVVLDSAAKQNPAMLSKPEACAYLGIGLAALNRKLSRREIPYYKLGKQTKRGGGNVLIAKKDLDRYLAACRISA